MQNLYFVIDLTDTEHDNHYRGAVRAVCTDWNDVQKFLEAQGVIVLHQTKEYKYPGPLDETWDDWLDEPNPDTDLHFWVLNPEKTRHGLQHFTVDVQQPWQPDNPHELRYSP